MIAFVAWINVSGKKEQQQLVLQQVNDNKMIAQQWIDNAEKGSIDVYDTDIILKRGEVCYHIDNINWYETRKVRTGVTYHGPRYRIGKSSGLSYTIGHYQGKVHSHDETQKIDSGSVYVTNQRIIFNGDKGVKQFKLDKVVDINLYDDSVYIKKETGKPFWMESQNPYLLGMVAGYSIENL